MGGMTDDAQSDTAQPAPTQPARRVAVVSGAARGIGAAVARRLAADGRDVALVDLADATPVADELRASGVRAFAVQADVTDAAAVKAAFADVADRLGPPTILVNNAGVLRDNLLFRMTEDDWDTVLSVHLRGAFLMSRAAQASMVEAGWGRVVNLSSTSAHGNRGQANYSAAKAGMVGFTKTLAFELGKFGITANAVAPGMIETDMLRATAERLGITFDEYAAGAIPSIPVGRVGQPEDVANVVGFLASEAAEYVTGELVHVSGGFGV
jgi:3-oxoacyl-[acyl-carrier protein] reductase